MKRKLAYLSVALLALAIGAVASMLTYRPKPVSVASEAPKTAQSAPIASKTVTQTVTHTLSPSDINTAQLYELTNQDRKEYGVAPLRLNQALNASAQAKCDDMVAKDYFAHNSPSGETPWHYFTQQGIPNIALAENLAVGLDSAISVNTGWMKSPEHRVNILNSRYTDVGYGVCYSPRFDQLAFRPALLTVEHFAEY